MTTSRSRFLNAIWQYCRDHALEDREIAIARLMLVSLEVGDMANAEALAKQFPGTRAIWKAAREEAH